jgi:predicted NAD-dependent protein-ADP-ribosyltransferase YbiA (DUF1768 family)
MPILFYRHEDPYGCFSNFSRHTVALYGRTWMTSEHAFQAAKFIHSPEHMELVFNAPTPGQAANKHGRNRSYPLRPDWDAAPGADYAALVERLKQVPEPSDGINRAPVQAESILARTKDLIMYEVCYAKFTQHADLQKILLGTGNEILIEDTTSSGDAYWGWGSSLVGENKLGRILMAIRSEILASKG